MHHFPILYINYWFHRIIHQLDNTISEYIMYTSSYHTEIPLFCIPPLVIISSWIPPWTISMILHRPLMYITSSPSVGAAPRWDRTRTSADHLAFGPQLTGWPLEPRRNELRGHGAMGLSSIRCTVVFLGWRTVLDSYRIHNFRWVIVFLFTCG